ncbi:MAG: protein kinase [bacterium]|nr:MAG: protein kinase [bacterium]
MIGNKILHYEILEKVGQGGMGVVYKALDTSLNRKVALKFLPTHLTKDKASRKRFMVEAQAASALDHSNICTIHEINETPDGQLYICMAYYEGESLRQKIKKGPIPFDEALNIFFQIAQGIKAAHEENIIHRDIKPGNIIITDKGELKIVDFGLAKLAGVDLTKSTSSKGTAAYMCPEQIRQQKVDHRCDIWALGIVLYELLTGKLPFKGDYPEPMMYAIVNEEPKPLSDYLKNVPELLQAIVDKLLKKNPQERYQNISDLLLDLEPFVKESEPKLKKPRPTIFKLLLRKRAYLYGSLAVILVFLLLIIGQLYIFQERSVGKSIAVMPLESITQDAEQEWFTDGMTDALITELAQISGLRVISRSSSMQYKEFNVAPPKVAFELGVQYLVDGSVVKIGDVVKISARLIDALQDEYIWAKDYERGFSNVLGLQGEIAAAIAGQIEVRLTPQEEKRLVERRPVNPETYEMYMKGMYHLNKRTPESLEKGITYLHQTVERDPTEPLAHAGLSLGYSIMAHTPKPIPGSSKLCKEEALKALELDDNLAEAHLALAMVKIYGDWDKRGAGESYRKALELNPNLSLALMHYGYYELLMGNYEDAPRYLQRAIELDPLSNIYTAELGWMNYFLHEYDQTIELALKSLELVPNFPFALFVLGEGYAGKGMYDRAVEVQKKSADLSPFHEFGLAHTYALAGYPAEALKIAEKLEKRSEIWDTWCLAVIYAGLGDADKVFYWLEKAYEEQHPYIQWMKTHTTLDAFKNDPRYQDLVKRMNLP